MTQDEKVELVARALAATEAANANGLQPWELAELARAAIAALSAIPVEEPTTGDARLKDAAYALLRQWNAYRDSDLNQMNAHDLLVRYELWNALDAALWPALAQSQPTPDKDEFSDWRCVNCKELLTMDTEPHVCPVCHCRNFALVDNPVQQSSQ